MMNTQILLLFRPLHYVKNLIIFAPAFFGGVLLDSSVFSQVFLAFVSFCFASSFIYIVNDARDVEYDRKHPVKKNRPLAAGTVTLKQATPWAIALLFGALTLAFLVSIQAFTLVTVYILLNVLYSFGLKNVPIIDLLIVSTGFVLRLFTGGVASGVVLSEWIIALTFILSLLLITAKRRDDVLIYSRTQVSNRYVASIYNIKVIDSIILLSAVSAAVFYVMWTIFSDFGSLREGYSLTLTAFFVIAGLIKYALIVFKEEKSGNPTDIMLENKTIQLITICWVGSLVWYVYL